MSLIYSDPILDSLYAPQSPQGAAQTPPPAGAPSLADAYRKYNEGRGLMAAGTSGAPATALQGVSRLVQTLAGNSLQGQGITGGAQPQYGFGGMAQQGGSNIVPALMSAFALGGGLGTPQTGGN